MKFAKVTIDGVEYTLAFEYLKVVAAEKLTGVNLLTAIDGILTGGETMTAGQLLGLFYAALEAGPEAAFPGKTPAQSLQMAANLLRLDTLTLITRGILDAYRLALGLPETEEDETGAEQDPALVS